MKTANFRSGEAGDKGMDHDSGLERLVLHKYGSNVAALKDVADSIRRSAKAQSGDPARAVRPASIPRPEETMTRRPRVDRLDEAEFRESSFREKLFEHIFVSELLQEAWTKHRQMIDVLRSEVDNAGYDLV